MPTTVIAVLSVYWKICTNVTFEINIRRELIVTIISIMITETHPKPCQTSETELLKNIVNYNYFCKKLHLTCLEGFCMRLWISVTYDK